MQKMAAHDLVMEFPGVRALDQVSVGFEAAEVHGVIGENGAGKSTLMKILGGIQLPTSGSLDLDGKPVVLHGVRHAQGLGIAMIHQELNLVDELTVAENVFLGRESSRAGWLDRAAMNRATQSALAEVQAAFPPTTKVGELSIAGKQLVEIAKAVAADASVLIMDEPTAVLSEPESQALFALIARLKAKGVTVLYISHRLAEVCEICDRITVLRDGKWITTIPADQADPAKLADLMVGRAMQDFYPPKAAPPAAPAKLEIKARSGQGICIAPGEIVALAGLVGAGRTELAEAVIGVRPLDGWQVLVDGKPARFRSPREAIRQGVAYVSEDRKKTGLHVTLSVLWNLTMANLSAYGSVMIRTGLERSSGENWRKQVDIRTGSLEVPVMSLSGGNQQKVSVAKWLDTRPKVLILDEPTRGVDVGARRELYLLVQKLAQEGMACLVISSDLPEVIGLCHRAAVMRDGKIVGELKGEQLTEEAVIRLAAGVEAA